MGTVFYAIKTTGTIKIILNVPANIICTCIVISWECNVKVKFLTFMLKKITELGKLEKRNNNMYSIVCIIDDHYIVQTPKGLQKVKISSTNKKYKR